MPLFGISSSFNMTVNSNNYHEHIVLITEQTQVKHIQIKGYLINHSDFLYSFH